MKRELSNPSLKYDPMDSVNPKHQISKQKRGKQSYLNYSRTNENDKHEVNSSVSRGTHKSQASGEILNINTKEGSKE